METVLYITKEKISLDHIHEVAISNNYEILWFKNERLQIKVDDSYLEWNFCSIENGRFNDIGNIDLDKYIELGEPQVFFIDCHIQFYLIDFVKLVMKKYGGWLSEDIDSSKMYDYSTIDKFINDFYSDYEEDDDEFNLEKDIKSFISKMIEIYKYKIVRNKHLENEDIQKLTEANHILDLFNEELDYIKEKVNKNINQYKNIIYNKTNKVYISENLLFPKNLMEYINEIKEVESKFEDFIHSKDYSELNKLINKEASFILYLIDNFNSLEFSKKIKAPVHELDTLKSPEDLLMYLAKNINSHMEIIDENL